jgi:hypothetical protein
MAVFDPPRITNDAAKLLLMRGNPADQLAHLPGILAAYQQEKRKDAANKELAKSYGAFTPQEQTGVQAQALMQGTQPEISMGPEVSRQAQATASGLFPESLIATESGGNWAAQNNEVGSSGRRGHYGRLQFSRDRIDESKKALGKDFTIEEFLQNPELQREVENWHFSDINNYIAKNGLDQYMGQEVKGQVMTPGSMQAVAHLGGKGGLKRFLTDPKYNPKDAFGTHLTDYAKKHANGGSSDVTRMATAGVGGGGSGGNIRPDSIAPQANSYMRSPEFKEALLNVAQQGGDVTTFLQDAKALESSLQTAANNRTDRAHKAAQTAWMGPEKGSQIAERGANTERLREETRWIGPKAESTFATQALTRRQTNLAINELEEAKDVRDKAIEANTRYWGAQDAFTRTFKQDYIEKLKEHNGGKEPTALEMEVINDEAQSAWDSKERPELLRQIREDFPKSYHLTEPYKEQQKEIDAQIKQLEEKSKSEQKIKEAAIDRLGTEGAVGMRNGTPTRLSKAEEKRIKRKQSAESIRALIMQNKDLAGVFKGGRNEPDMKVLVQRIRDIATEWNVEPDELVKATAAAANQGWTEWSSGIDFTPEMWTKVNDIAKSMRNSVDVEEEDYLRNAGERDESEQIKAIRDIITGFGA